jgi:hypothetical protein
MDDSVKKWIESASEYLISQWGIDKDFAPSVALLFLYLSSYGLSPTITSGFRSPEKQQELYARWKAGDPSIKYKPAENSKHCNTDWLGRPASLAVDISTSDPNLAAEIARALKIKPGNDFGDPVHFYL